VLRLDEQRPDFGSGRQELGLGIDAHARMIVTIPAQTGH